MGGARDERRARYPLPERGLAPRGGAIIHHVKIKCHAACGAAHAAIDGINELLLGAELPIERIARIRLDVPRATDKICNIPMPSTGLELKFSFRGVAAMSILGIGTASIDSFSTATAIDAKVLRAMELVDLNLVDDMQMGRSRVVIELSDGRTLEARERAMLQDSLGRRVAGKFETLTAPRLGIARTRALRDLVFGSEEAVRLRQITDLSAPIPA